MEYTMVPLHCTKPLTVRPPDGRMHTGLFIEVVITLNLYKDITIRKF